jgi:NADPH:quinone reductase-like Zn-dependent oxidoreductase
MPTGVGNEGVGRILAEGGAVNHLHVGDRVLLPRTVPTWRERLVVPAAELFPVPSDAGSRQLAMLRINPPTAALPHEGIYSVLFTTHRQNYLVPPRRHRAFPLAEFLA